MNVDIQTRMLDALEIFHYSFKFKNDLFVLVIKNPKHLDKIIVDLRVLHSSHIKVLILCTDFPQLQQKLSSWNERGCRFEFWESQSEKYIQESLLIKIKEVQIEDRIPVLSFSSHQVDASEFKLEASALKMASFLEADKLFLFSEHTGLNVDGVFQSHPSPNELDQFIKKGKNLNIDRSHLQNYRRFGKKHGIEMVLLEGKSGSLYTEIFTHNGSGTLITNDYPNLIRKAKLSDVMELSLLIKHYVHEGIILPIAEEVIVRSIDHFFVYTINDSIVAASTLIEYGKTAELAKFCTLPRFQGKGRAKKLALRMIEEAKRGGKKYVFALSILDKMWDFFLGLGFAPISRKELPTEWQVSYDFSRSSKAFSMKL